jgi:hypothetical protein
VDEIGLFRFLRSSVTRFDERNHPVQEEELSKEQRRRCRWRRCYKWVELIHTNSRSEFFFFVAMALGPGQAHESPILYDLVEKFLQSAGPGVFGRPGGSGGLIRSGRWIRWWPSEAT